ncbi:MAG: nitroreductase/quinone reductase family protein [Lapillicoccus sp.]
MDYRETNRKVIPAFRSGGPLPGMHRERLLLLTTTGRRTGNVHTTPMMFHREGGRLFVIASNVGAPRDPDWCLNLRADPAVTVEVGDSAPGEAGEADSPAYAATAAVIEGADRAAVWPRIIELYPFFADHEKTATPREIPVVELTRA